MKKHMSEIEDLDIENVLSQAKISILNTGNLTPTLIIDTEKKGILHFPLANFPREYKYEYFYLLGKTVSKLKVKSFIHISKGWVVFPEGDDMPDVPASQHPDRRELLMVIFSNKSKVYKSKFALIERSPDGVVFSEPEKLNEPDIETRSNLLDTFWDGVESDRET